MNSRVMKLCCQGCGADLQVTEDLRFITCNYCQSKLEIVRDVSVTHTRVLEKLERTTERIAGNLRVIELQNDLERMDREWEKIREVMMLRGKDGHLYEPSTGSAVSLGVVGGIVGVTVIIGSSVSAAPLGVVIGLGIAGVAGVAASKSFRVAEDFQGLKKRFQAQRERMIRLIETERGR